MWAFLANLFSGGAIGAITGLFGVAVQRYFDLKNANLKIQADAQGNAHELEMKKLDLETMKAEAQNAFAVSKLEAQTKESLSADDLQKAAYALEPKTYSDESKLSPFFNGLFAWLDVVRGLIRPGLTVFFAAAFMVVFWQCIAILKREGMTINPEEAYALVQKCVDLVITLFATCTTFYFGTRNKSSEAKARGRA